jgi:predicted GNAT family N-acyltransferase
MQFIHIPLHETDRFKEDLISCILIRKEVFVSEQSVPSSIEQDGKDEISSHLLLKKENVSIGTLRIRDTEEGVKLERIAVIKKYRGQGIGKHLVTHAIRIILKEDPHAIIYIHAQQHATHFYASMGFVPTDETTIEAGIAHVSMVFHR